MTNVSEPTATFDNGSDVESLPPGACSGPLPPSSGGGHSPTRPSPSAVPSSDAGAGDQSSDAKSESGRELAGHGDLQGTYSPEDNKLRLRSLYRLDNEAFQRVKAAGFRWAPKQDLFVAPAWTPEREDLLIELCGEVDDEDTTLMDRAEERSERFEGFADSRTRDAEVARKSVAAIADNIPLGQPILVGHHSERRARRDAERIENGMRRAVKMWETSEYWTRRAAAAVSHALYKEQPPVRHRRIKGLEADLRKERKTIEQAEAFSKLWERCQLTREQAMAIANHDHISVRLDPADKWGDSLWSLLDKERIDVQKARTMALGVHARTIARCNRWVAHLENRIAYERAMLGESGGIVADRFSVEVGGQALCRWGWGVVMRVNRKAGQVVSLRISNHGVRGIEEIKDYRPPQGDTAARVAAATKLPPLCNYPGAGFLHMTKAGYEKSVPRWSDFPKIVMLKATSTAGRHRVRQTRKEGGNYWDTASVFITDAKRVDPPKPIASKTTTPLPPTLLLPPASPPPPLTLKAPDQLGAAMESLRDRLRAGIKVVSAPHLFPTPAHLAARMTALACIAPNHRVLEPSAGTGALLDALTTSVLPSHVTAVEINPSLAQALAARRHEIVCGDFLQIAASLGQFDRILMNPPFDHGVDIKHIEQALALLGPGGRLVALCANGPRQKAALWPRVDACGGLWEELPPDTFVGTSVRAVLLTIIRS